MSWWRRRPPPPQITDLSTDSALNRAVTALEEAAARLAEQSLIQQADHDMHHMLREDHRDAG